MMINFLEREYATHRIKSEVDHAFWMVRTRASLCRTVIPLPSLRAKEVLDLRASPGMEAFGRSILAPY